MNKNYVKVAALVAFSLAFGLTVFLNASEMSERVHDATRILEKRQMSGHPIPEKLLKQAKGVAIFDSTKAGIGIGGQGGEGIVIARKNRSWRAPLAFDVGGGSIGAQLGFAENRYIVLLMTEEALHHFVYPNEANWNATASSTLGADTDTARASTGDLKHGAILVYNDSDGVFGGATLGGTGIDRNDDVNRQAYGRGVDVHDVLSGKVSRPKYAKHLYRLLNG